MTKQIKTAGEPNAKRRITIERTYQAPIEEVWELWTTKEGIESWWGPDGFSVKVHSIDLRPGGELRYAMTAIAPLQIEFMKKAGMPLTTEARVRYDRMPRGRRALSRADLAHFLLEELEHRAHVHRIVGMAAVA